MTYLDGRPQRYQVTAAQIVVPDPRGGELYVRKGRFIPANTRADVIDRLLEVGLIEEVTA